VNREVHARFYEGRGVKFPPATHQRHIAGMDATCWNAAGTVQVRVSLWTWGFKSPLAHHQLDPASALVVWHGSAVTYLVGSGCSGERLVGGW
jgi:hypothetical protein